MVTIAKKQSTTEIEQMIMSRFSIAHTEAATHINKWRNLLYMYNLGTRKNLERKTDERGKTDHMDQGIANVSASILWNAVETLSPRQMANFNPEGWFSAVPRTGTPLESAQYMENKIKTQLDDCHAQEVFLRATKQAIKLGGSVLKLRWNVEVGKRYERKIFVNDSGNPYEDFVRTEGIVYDGPVIELVPYWNWFPDPKGLTLYDMEYVCEEIIMSVDDLDHYVELGLFDGSAVKKAKKASEANNYGQDITTSNDQRYFHQDHNRKDVRVIGYYEDKRFLYISAQHGSYSNGILLNPKKNENPYDHQSKPFIHFQVNLDETNFWTPGVIEVLRDDQAIMSTLINMTLDAGIMELRPMRMVEAKELDVDIKEMQNYVPNKIIPVEQEAGDRRPLRDKIVELKPEPGGFVSMLPALIGIMGNEAQKKSGVTSYLDATAGIGSNKTARGVMQLTQNAEVRNSIMTQCLSVGATRLLEMLLSMNQQFSDPGENLYGRYDFKVFENSTADQSTRIQTLQWALPIIAQAGGNYMEALKRILKIAGEPAIEQILPSDGSMKKNEQNQLRGQLMQSMLQQGGSGGQGG